MISSIVSRSKALEWYVRRIAVMSPGELMHRAREMYRRKVVRQPLAGWSAFDIGDGPVAKLEPLLRFGAAKWPEALARQVDAAAGTPGLAFLGQDWPEDALIGKTPGLWTMDPVSGLSWAGREQFCFDVQWRSEAQKGDVKFVLELNRLQTLQAMAAIAIRDRNARLAEEAAEILLSWMEENPPFMGVNWLSCIELALRAVSIGFVATALETVAPGHRYGGSIRALMAAHAYWIDRFPSLHSSANNHRVAEGLGLWVAAETVPDMPNAERYRSEGRSILIEAATSQFHEDGTGKEQSPTYTAFTVEAILLGIMLGRAHGQELPADVERRLVKAARQLRAMLDDDGNCPRIGDDDEGRVIACPAMRDDRYVASVVAAAAGVLAAPELAPPNRDLHLRDIVFGSPGTCRGVAAGVTVFAAGGYTVVRDHVNGRNMMLVMDHGPLGLWPLAAHGHADALAVWLHLDGQPVFVDAGTYSYHTSGAMRDHLRSTASHNTLMIAGESQSLPAGPFNWRHRATGRLVDANERLEDWSVTGVHDGYRKRFGVIHRRTCRRSDGGFVIEDALDGEVAVAGLQIGFLLHPGLNAERSPDGSVRISRKGHALLRLVAPSETAIEIISRENSRTTGNVYSGRYNHLAAATRIVYRPHAQLQRHAIHIEIQPA